MIHPKVISVLILILISFYLIIIEGADFNLLFVICFLTTLLMSLDAGDWFLRNKFIFDPVCIISLFSYMYFFISPVLQSTWSYWPSFPELEYNRNWLLVWASLNLFGAVFYRFIIFNEGRKAPSLNNYIYYFNKTKFYKLIAVFMAVGVISQLYIYQKFGGISGFINTFSERQENSAAIFDPFEGMGIEMLLADGFRNLFAIFIIVYFKGSTLAKKWWFFIFILVSLVIVSFLFGGLKGSRGAVVYSVFWGVGMYHFWMKPIKVKHALLGIVSLMLFLNTYYWYKFAGIEGLTAMLDDNVKHSLNQGLREENTKFVISRDLGRMDFQTIALIELLDEQYPLAFGRSYLSSVFSVVPTSIISAENKPPSITKEKTELIYGQGSYIHGDVRATTNLLGQFGELSVNFGLFGCFIFYIILAKYSLFVRRIIQRSLSDDALLLLVPMLSLLAIQFMMYDSSVMVQFLMRNFIYISLLYVFCLKKHYVE
ncbi:hypothetical protein ATW7_08094 [Alteromonadales bacterium TW-7]|nr:hypothetical protein ATW7_08094 [Alteromonadales bacterium TW-7]